MRSVYDSRGRFETESYNSLEQVVTKTVNPYFGSVSAQTDVNGLTSSAEYDDFGNITYSTDADGVCSTVAYRWCKGDENAPSHAVYYIYSESSGGPPVIEYLDCFGRSLRKVAIGFDGTKIFADVEYDSMGFVARQSDPYFEDSSPQWTVFTYDEIGRVTKKTLPDNSEINIIYDGLTTTTENPLNQHDTKIVNHQGLIVSSTDNNSKTITYVYNSAGNLIETHDPAGNVVTMQYDLLGNRTKLIDPDLGTVTSKYNAFGELVKETDAKSQTDSMVYDVLGRLTKRIEPEGTSEWVYDTRTKGIGKISSVTGPNNISQSYEYDDLGRLEQFSETIDGNTYHTQTTYDGFGRISQVSYPSTGSTSDLVVRHEYNQYGYLKEVVNAGDNKIYWTAEVMNARGQLEQFKFGNNQRTTRTYNDQTGLLESIQTTAGGNYIQNWAYSFNSIGSLMSRWDISRNLNEEFVYDNLNRLTTVKKNGSQTLSVTYDDLGNITSKSDVGSYTYDPTGDKPHAVQMVMPDVPNSILNTASQNIDYTSFNKVRKIYQSSDSVVFTYGIAHERKTADTWLSGSLAKRKTYLGNLYEKEYNFATGETVETFYIFGGEGVAAILTISSTETTATHYVHKDHLGSIQYITNESGALEQELSYDAWGNRRDPATWAVYSNIPANLILDRGFTGHEHIDLFALVNMDGRVYDPVLGRFLSADPIIQNPENLQSLNRYSYCLNNPLSLVDPSGYTWLSDNWRTLLTAAIAITATVVTAGILAPAAGTVLTASTAGQFITAAVVSGAAGGFAGGFSGALLCGADLGQAFKAGAVGGVIGAASGFLSLASGSVAGSGVGAMIERAAKHAFSNAWLNGITGQNMKHGFITGALSSFGNNYISGKTHVYALRVTASAVLGGTVEEIGGGKFANGAITGAYSMLFNDMMHELKERPPKGGIFRIDYGNSPEQERLTHFLYGIDYLKEKFAKTGQYIPYNVNDWFSNVTHPQGSTHTSFEGSITIKENTFNVNVTDFPATEDNFQFNWFNQGPNDGFPRSVDGKSYANFTFYKVPGSNYPLVNIRVPYEYSDLFYDRYLKQ